MKGFVQVVVLLCCVVGCSRPPPPSLVLTPSLSTPPQYDGPPQRSRRGQVTVKYDEFNKVNVVRIDKLELLTDDDHISFLMFTALAVHQPNKPNTSSALITLMSQSESWQYLQCHHVVFLADGEPVQLQEVKHDGRVGRGYVLEFVRVDIPALTFRQMANSLELRGRLCNTEFTFSQEQRKTLQNFTAQAWFSP